MVYISKYAPYNTLLLIFTLSIYDNFFKSEVMAPNIPSSDNGRRKLGSCWMKLLNKVMDTWERILSYKQLGVYRQLFGLVVVWEYPYPWFIEEEC